MKVIEWTEALSLNFEPMDTMNRQFVSLLAQAQEASDGELADRWRAVIDHTESHFAREDSWMRTSHFSTVDNHMLQHRVVLNVMREGLAFARAEKFETVREMASELESWFSKHTQSLDAALALHMRREPETAQAQKP